MASFSSLSVAPAQSNPNPQPTEKIKCEVPHDVYLALLIAFRNEYGTGYELDDALVNALTAGLDAIEAQNVQPSLYKTLNSQFENGNNETIRVTVTHDVARRILRIENFPPVKTKTRNAQECYYQFLVDRNIVTIDSQGRAHINRQST